MCGFVTIFDFKNTLNSEKAEQSLISMAHRGPDACNFTSDKTTYFVGHNRLSIIDLNENANQPFFSQDKRYFIVFNGEIYNYKDLKSQILFPFQTNSDTEVVLQGYLKEGATFFKKLRGMYAFVIGCIHSNQFILVRDPIGIKPLYIYKSQNIFIAASEIKAITTYVEKRDLSINELAIKSYLHNGYVAEPDTVYNEISALCPGTYMEINNGAYSSTPFFKFDFDSKVKHVDYDELEKTLKVAVNRNLVADIDISIALSGGIDSSLIYYLINQQKKGINAISVGMKEKEFDETETSKAYVDFLGGTLTKTFIEPEFSLNKLNKLLLHFDQPYSDTSFIPVYYLSQIARKESKVIIGGDGGDELFNGYPFMHLVYRFADNNIILCIKNFINLFKFLLPPSIKRQLFRIDGVIGKNVSLALFNINSWIPIDTKFKGKSIFKYDTKDVLESNTNFSNEKANTKAGKIIRYKFRRVLLSDYLRKTDMMSMLNSLELRVPFLDEDLCIKAFELSFIEKSTLQKSKIPLRKLHLKYFDGLGNKLKKKGFSVPLDKYLSDSDKQEMIETILKPDSYLHKFITKEYLFFLCEQFKNYTAVNMLERSAVYQRIVIFYSLQIWFDSYEQK
jgi:asparagine synthase (glutamine-hydrolysing)